jgi:beta-phosphoglucomutase-like phosphatase (HAD superfamily)
MALRLETFGDPKGKSKSLFIFDFDDTLAETHSKVWVNNPTKGRYAITPAQYAVYNPEPGDEFDFYEFTQLIEPVELPKYVQRLRSAIKAGQAVSIVTARGSSAPVAQFLQQIGINKGVKIAAIGSSDPQAKMQYIDKKLKTGGFTDVIMYDDSPKNINAFKDFAKKHPNVYFHGHEVPAKPKPDPKQDIRNNLGDTIKNPETGNDILVKTALGYEKSHPVYQLAMKYLRQQRKTS